MEACTSWRRICISASSAFKFQLQLGCDALHKAVVDRWRLTRRPVKSNEKLGRASRGALRPSHGPALEARRENSGGLAQGRHNTRLDVERVEKVVARSG